MAVRRKPMFSPIVAIASVSVSPTDFVPPSMAAPETASALPFVPSVVFAMRLTISWNWSLRATKSVSELTSTTAALLPDVAMPIRPSDATRPDFFSALEIPLARSQSIDDSMSPSFSLSAFLQSIMPAPVLSRSSLTMAAVMVIVFLFPLGSGRNGCWLSFQNLIICGLSQSSCHNNGGFCSPAPCSLTSRTGIDVSAEPLSISQMRSCHPSPPA
jgi:hypothetical protein